MLSTCIVCLHCCNFVALNLARHCLDICTHTMTTFARMTFLGGHSDIMQVRFFTKQISMWGSFGHLCLSILQFISRIMSDCIELFVYSWLLYMPLVPRHGKRIV